MSETKPSKVHTFMDRISLITDRIADIGSLAVALLVPILWVTGKLPMTREVIMLYVSTLAVIAVSLALYRSKRARRR